MNGLASAREERVRRRMWCVCVAYIGRVPFGHGWGRKNIEIKGNIKPGNQSRNSILMRYMLVSNDTESVYMAVNDSFERCLLSINGGHDV